MWGETVISNRTLSLCVCALLVTSSLCHSEQMTDLNGKKIPFKLFGKYLVVVEGSIGGLKKKNFLIDTGTNPTIVDEQIAKQLQLRSLTGMPDTLPVVTGVVRASFAVLSTLQFGPITRDSVKVVIEDLSPLRDKVGTRVDAVVGLDVLGSTSFRIDYSKKAIIFGPLDVSASTVPFNSGPPFVTVPITIENRPLNLLVDTGTAGLVLFQSRLGAWHRGLPQLGMATTSGLAGQIYLPVMQVTTAFIGNHEIGIRRIYLSGGQNCCSFDGLIGISADQMKEIGFDFERKLFAWRLQDRAIPTMSEAGLASCLPASAPGLVPRSQASGALVAAFASGCESGSTSHPR
jgi:hypothetical protein